MKRHLIYPALLLAPFGSYLFFGLPSWSPSVSIDTVEIVKGPLAVWSNYEGKLESRDVRMIMSKYKGGAVVVELAPEGAKVSKGDVLVRFDSSSIEREIFKLERERALAQLKLEGLQLASIPLERREIEMELMEARSTLTAEQQYLDASIELAREGLVSDQEVEQQRLEVERVKTEVETLEQKMQLTNEFLHPSILNQARAELISAEQEVTLARGQLQNSVIFAPIDGVVVYRRLNIGTEFRTIRISDEIGQNQSFMMIPDMKEFVVHIAVPEGELSRVQEGQDVSIRPLSYPEMKIQGSVEKVGSMAQNLPGQPSWKKFFPVMIGIKETNPRLKPGMSVTAYVLSYYNPEAVLVPRTAVKWKDGKPFVHMRPKLDEDLWPVRLGLADDANYEVIEGLNHNDRVYTE